MKNHTPVIVPLGNLEKHNLAISCFRILTVPLLNILPSRIIKNLMRRSSRDASDVIESSGSTKSLEVMYTRGFRKSPRWTLGGIANAFWHNVVSQPKALRNRLKITKSAIEHNISYIISEGIPRHDSSPIRILSIAGGSSRSTIQVVTDLRKNGITQKIEVITVDKDQSALDIGRQLAADTGVSSDFHWVCGTAHNINTLIPNKRFDIVEIVGLLDYFDDERIIRLMKTARNVMHQDSIMVAANVMPNPEIPFVYKMGWPKMVYRTHKDFKALFERSGFTKTETIIEPMKVHCVIIAKNE